MKWYHHTLIIIALILFTLFFYQNGYGFVSFLIAAVYFALIFYKEVKRLKKENANDTVRK